MNNCVEQSGKVGMSDFGEQLYVQVLGTEFQRDAKRVNVQSYSFEKPDIARKVLGIANQTWLENLAHRPQSRTSREYGQGQ